MMGRSECRLRTPHTCVAARSPRSGTNTGPQGSLKSEALRALRELGPRTTYGTPRETLGTNNGPVGESLRALKERA